MTTMTESTTRTLRRPGAVLTYDVRRATGTTEPVLLLIGSPMGAGGFGTLAEPLRRPHRRDLRPARRRAQHEGRSREPVDARGARRRPASGHRGARRRARSTCSPAAAGRSTRWRSWPRTPSDVRTLVAHEPPLASILPDREAAMAAAEASTTRTSAAASAPAWRSSSRREPPGAVRPRSSPTSPRPDPAMFGMPAEDDGTRTDALLGQNIITCTHYEPDFDALRAASTRIVLAAGVESEGEMAHRGAMPSPSAWHEPVDLPERPRRLPRRRVRPDRRAGCLRGEAARGPRRGLTASLFQASRRRIHRWVGPAPPFGPGRGSGPTVGLAADVRRADVGRRHVTCPA